MPTSLGTFVELLDQILHPDEYYQNWVLDSENIPQIRSLFEKAIFLRNFLASSTSTIQSRIDTLEDVIRDAAENAEDSLNSHIKAQLLSNPIGHTFTITPPDFTQLIQVFDSAIAEMNRIIDAGTEKPLENTPHVVSTGDLQAPNDVMVGTDTCFIQLKDRLTRSPALQIIPIVGMGGIGKTTLARKLYDQYSSNKSRFDICAWATVSQEYDQHRIILSLLRCIKGDLKSEILELKTEKLVDILYKELFRTRYLIVLDDIWSSKVWDDIRMCFNKEDNQGSRIILTTRENQVADYVGIAHNSKKHEMNLLNETDSLELFKRIVFGDEMWPSELEELAQKIANSCGGLPLAIKVVAGFVSRIERSRNVWEEIAHDVKSFVFVKERDEQFSRIFSWSYAHLPHYLKPCLLYIGAFPEDHEIPASKLVKLWVAEGFLNPIKNKTSEEVAEMYLQALVDRNVIFVRRRTTYSGRVRSYGIHDLLRDLCLRKAQDKKFIYAKNLKYEDLSDALCVRRVCTTSSNGHGRVFSGPVKLMPQVHTFQIIGGADGGIFPDVDFDLSLLRVLDVLSIKLPQFPEEITKLVSLRYLAISCEPLNLPESISVLKNLQTIIFRFWEISDYHYFQMRIFHLPQLRHVKFWSYFPPGLPTVVPSISILKALQSLSVVSLKILTPLLGKLPNLKKLGIFGSNSRTPTTIDLTCFQKLESTKVSRFAYLNPIFPNTLKKLTISEAWNLTATFMSSIGSLQNLQLLRLVSCSFESATWKLPSEEGEFCNLQYLLLHSRNLVNWEADETHFGRLKHLIIQHCPDLNKFPISFMEKETLEIIEVDKCKHSVFNLAKKILQEQLDLCNEDLQLRLGDPIRGSEEEELKRKRNDDDENDSEE